MCLAKITHIIGKSLGRSSAPRALPISSLVSLESSWQGLSNATKLDIGDARGAEYRPVLRAKTLTKKVEKSMFFNKILRSSIFIFEYFLKTECLKTLPTFGG